VNTNFYLGTCVGLLGGGLLMMVATPAPVEPIQCGVQKVSSVTETAYVLKAPEPQKCLPTTVEVKVPCEKEVSPIIEEEPKPRRKARRRHRRYRRYF